MSRVSCIAVLALSNANVLQMASSTSISTLSQIRSSRCCGTTPLQRLSCRRAFLATAVRIAVFQPSTAISWLRACPSTGDSMHTASIALQHQSHYGLRACPATERLEADHHGAFRYHGHTAHMLFDHPPFRVHWSFAYELGVMGKSCMSDMHIG
jgi:hypothetical protein